MKPEPRIDEDGVGRCNCGLCTNEECCERSLDKHDICLPYARQQAKEKNELETENKRVRSELAMLLAEFDTLKLVATQGERMLKKEIERLREALATVRIADDSPNMRSGIQYMLIGDWDMIEATRPATETEGETDEG